MTPKTNNSEARPRFFKVTEISQLPTGVGINFDVKDDECHVVVTHSVFLSYEVLPPEMCSQMAAAMASANNYIKLNENVGK